MYQKLDDNKSKLIISIMAVFLVIAIAYIIFTFLQNFRKGDIQQAYQNGYNQGLTAAVIALYQQTNNCQATTITIGNITRQVIDTACLVQK